MNKNDLFNAIEHRDIIITIRSIDTESAFQMDCVTISDDGEILSGNDSVCIDWDNSLISDTAEGYTVTRETMTANIDIIG